MEAVKRYGKSFTEAVKEEAETLRDRLPQLEDATSGLGHGILKNTSIDFSINVGKPADQIISVAKSEYYEVSNNENYEVEKNKHYEVGINLPAFKLPGFNLPASSPSPSQLEYSTSQMEKSEHYEVAKTELYEVDQTNKHYEVDINLPAFKLPSFNLPVSSAPSPSLLESSSSQLQIENEAKYLRDKSIEELRELYLEKLYHEKQGPCEFYCPNCKVSITKVLVQEREPIAPPVPAPDEPIRCTSCFSFLIPTVGPDQTPLLHAKQRSPKSWEIMKSIVYGGLTESFTSLCIVTSAASGDASISNIVALALANLLAGLFVIGQNLWQLKHYKPKVSAAGDTGTEDQHKLARYEKVLGKRYHFSLHAFLAILSFLVFGLVPPIVYSFSFRESNDKDLKLAAVVVASLSCITLLSLAKAHTQKPSNSKYIKTVMFYVVVGFGVSGASYLAGDLIHKLMKITS